MYIETEGLDNSTVMPFEGRMNFEEIAKLEQPAYEVFKRAHELVFDAGDGVTEHLDRLSRDARLVYQVWNLDGEIHNGGFDQLFVNSLGDYCVEILSYLKEIGAKNSERLLSQAMSYFPEGQVPCDRSDRVDLWIPISENEVVEEGLNALDREFYEYKDNLVGILDEYVRSHPNAKIQA